MNTEVMKPANDTVGIHYELPDGRIAMTCGWDGKLNVVSYYFDDDEGARTVPEAEWQNWAPRPDLKDFPNARDPRLPYVFDFLWDIKHMSGLRQALLDEHDDIRKIREAMASQGLLEEDVLAIKPRSPMKP